MRLIGTSLHIRRDEGLTNRGELLLPETMVKLGQTGKVIGCGPGRFNQDGTWESVRSAVGSRVLFRMDQGLDAGDGTLFLKDELVYCVLGNEERV